MPDYLCISSIPTQYKELIYKKLISNAELEKNLEYQSILNFMMQTTGCEDKWKTFIKKTKNHDKHRNEKFSDVFPEYYDLIKESFSVEN